MTDPELAHLFARLGVVEEQVRRAVAAFRAVDARPDDPFRGLYLSEQAVDEIMASRREPVATEPDLAERQRVLEAAEPGSRLGRLAAAAGLVPLDVALLLVAMLPEVDGRFEALYGYLNDDVTRRRVTVGLALRLCGMPEAGATGRARLHADGRLVGNGLLAVEEPDRPLLSRGLRVPDRVVDHLLGDDRPDAALAGVLTPGGPPVTGLPETERVALALRAGVGTVHLRDGAAGGGREVAVAALAAVGRGALCADAAGMTAGTAEREPVARVLLREALLGGQGVVIGPVDELADPAAALAVLTRCGVPVLVHGTTQWGPRWSPVPPPTVDVAPASPAVRAALWREAVAGGGGDGIDPVPATQHFRLGPAQIRRAAAVAELAARGDGGEVTASHLRSGARSQNATGLERLARRIEPAVGWPDLVLPDPVLAELAELSARARRRDQVLGTWRMRPGGGRGRGVTALFAGDSGTGKTMSAEIIAADLGLDLYAVNLATVVDKYVGETEKNLERIFDEAAGVNGVLLFDEADALFGKRSEVRDAHDRYANIESAYLLQRMEAFDGLAVLATNLRSNLDDAFTRRLDALVDFPVPDEPLRRRLWDACLGTEVPRAADVDLDFLAASFELAGGHIRSVTTTAAYLAAGSTGAVDMAHLVRAVAREYRKLGRLCLAREFGEHLELATTVHGPGPVHVRRPHDRAEGPVPRTTVTT